jgi:uncharacterized protein Usg
MSRYRDVLKALTFDPDDVLPVGVIGSPGRVVSTARGCDMSTEDFARQLQGYGLTTAHILYGFPDHPRLLQNFIWQEYDLAPKFPQLHKFLDFWRRELEGPLHSVRVAHSALIKPAEFSLVNGVMTLH